ASKILQSKPYIATAVPKGKEEFVLKYLLHGNYEKINGWVQGPFINRVSVMKTNYNRIQKTFEQMEGYKEEDQIQTKNWKKNDEIIITNEKSLKAETIYSFNEGTDENLFIVPVWSHYVASIGKPVDFKDVMEYYKYRQKNSGHYLSNTPTEIADHYSDSKPGQIHNKKLGEKFKDDLSDEGIGCAHGVILTPKGAYNIQTQRPTPDNPLGWKPEEITPNNFKVTPYKFYQKIHGEKLEGFLKKGNHRLTGESFIKDVLTKIRLKTFDDILYS
ncbi:hypothetical protein K9L67_03085, partial [Candidatus Woesearchaeota archaeon]|nr:hypothetical protein [Candidatus Woesearchaeota archaeon]